GRTAGSPGRSVRDDQAHGGWRSGDPRRRPLGGEVARTGASSSSWSRDPLLGSTSDPRRRRRTRDERTTRAHRAGATCSSRHLAAPVDPDRCARGAGAARWELAVRTAEATPPNGTTSETHGTNSARGAPEQEREIQTGPRPPPSSSNRLIHRQTSTESDTH